MTFSKEYNNIKGDYEDFLNEVKRTVEKLLKKDGIPIAFNVSGRLKELDSIEEKHNSKRVIIKKSITELKDLVGLRIVLLFPDYKSEVINLLSNKFSLLEEPKMNEKEPDNFGYSSVHLILGINQDWIKAPSWESHGTKIIEVQIRTLSEHIWAETSHILFYKREENIPKIIRRDLYKLKALLEVGDDKLLDIKNNVNEHFEYIKGCDYSEILEMDLHAETFNRVMKQNSGGLYNYDEKRNIILSSQIEDNYNILNTEILDSIIKGKIDVSNIDESTFVLKVIELLDVYKNEINKNQPKEK